MDVLTLTSPAEVRAALGVSSTELPDHLVTLSMHSTVLSLAFENTHARLEPLCQELKEEPDPTPLQAKFLKLAKLFATYALADHLLASLPLFSVNRLADGKAEFARAPDAYEDVRAGVEGYYNMLRGRILALLTLLEPNTELVPEVTPVISRAVGLAVDPVTG